MAHTLTDRLRRAPPALHGEGEYWGLAWSALAWIEEHVQPGMATLEVGAGASTIVFASRGAAREAITPQPSEEERVRRQCASLGVESSNVTFRIGPSHEVLPSWEPRSLDLVLIDARTASPIRSSTGGSSRHTFGSAARFSSTMPTFRPRPLLWTSFAPARHGSSRTPSASARPVSGSSGRSPRRSTRTP